MMQQIVVCANIPQTGAIIGPINVSVSDTANYSVPFNSGSTYNWTVIGGNQISGVQNFITVQWTTTSGIGQLFVVETDSLGCSGDTVSLIINIGGVGVDEFQVSGLKFQVYPNPNTGEFTLEMEIPEMQEIQINITNILGQSIYAEILNNIKGNYITKINLKPNPAGIYNLQLINDKAIINKKLIIK